MGLRASLPRVRHLHRPRVSRAPLRIPDAQVLHLGLNLIGVVHEDRGDHLCGRGGAERGAWVEQVVLFGVVAHADRCLHEYWRLGGRRVHRGASEHCLVGRLHCPAVVRIGCRRRVERSGGKAPGVALRPHEAGEPSGLPLARRRFRHADQRPLVLVHRSGHGTASVVRQVCGHRAERVRVRGLVEVDADVFDGPAGLDRGGLVPGRHGARL
mmetsp:Transcript_109207/g.315548  ORF Transcript_109207/g.315548 Transcript_109207/m.315548 type:complete len:212 (-) Transcript_109207:850-1485(-)